VPERPAPGAPRTEEAKAEYVSGLRTWGRGCADDVTGMAERKAAYTERYDRENSNAAERLWRGITGRD
jgi:hypothetical protein